MTTSRDLGDLPEVRKKAELLEASKGFFDLLQTGPHADEESKLNFDLATALYDLGMVHSAQHYFMKVALEGANAPNFNEAALKLFAIAEMTGNETEIDRLVDRIPVESLPEQTQSHAHFLIGLQLLDAGNLSEAAATFHNVGGKSDLYLRSRYIEGIIYVEQGKYRSAVRAFRDVYESDAAPIDDRQAKEIEDFKDLALLDIARVYYGLQTEQGFTTANNFYSLVDRNSAYWPTSLYERAWSSVARNDLDRALGFLLNLQDPHFAEHEYLPEATILQAIIYFLLCQNENVTQTLLAFEDTYEPMRAEMKAFIDQYGGEEGKERADQAFDTYLMQENSHSKLTKALFVEILRNKDLADLVRYLDVLEKEEAEIDRQRPWWKDTIGVELKKMIEEDRQRYKRLAGLIVLREMEEHYKVLDRLVAQSQIIRFEVKDARRMGVEPEMQIPERESRYMPMFTHPRPATFWPFNGEFWSDELGYYVYAEESACNQSK